MFNSNRTIHYALLSTALGAIQGVIFKILMQTLPYQQIALVDSTFLCLFCLSIKGWDLRKLSSRAIKGLLWGSFLSGLGSFFYYLGINYLHPLEFSFIGRNQATFAILLGVFLLKEKCSLTTWVAIFLGCLGAMTFTYVENLTFHNLGGIFALGFCICFALRGWILKVSPSVGKAQLLFWGGVFSLLIALLQILYLTPLPLLELDWKSPLLLWIPLTTLTSQILGNSLFYKALEIGQLSLVSSIRTWSPLFVAIYSYLFFPVTWASQQVLGAIFIVLSMLLLTFFNNKK
jgi:drug/metabolite transporter (DMT)-like permease